MSSTSRAERCRKIAAAVESLSQMEMEELFRIIHDPRRTCYTRNNHGVFINLAWISEDLLKKIEEYVQFCHRSHHELKKYESICDVLNSKLALVPNVTIKDTLLATKNVRMVCNSSAFENAGLTVTGGSKTGNMQSKVSSSMRFYLLKKKYAKISGGTQNLENDLRAEEYVVKN